MESATGSRSDALGRAQFALPAWAWVVLLAALPSISMLAWYLDWNSLRSDARRSRSLPQCGHQLLNLGSILSEQLASLPDVRCCGARDRSERL